MSDMFKQYSVRFGREVTHGKVATDFSEMMNAKINRLLIHSYGEFVKGALKTLCFQHRGMYEDECYNKLQVITDER